MNIIQDRRARFMTMAALGLLAGLLPVALTPASAETPEQRQACTHDAFKLCSDSMPDVTRTKACLVKNAASLSTLCRTAMSGGGAVVHRASYHAKPKTYYRHH